MSPEDRRWRTVILAAVLAVGAAGILATIVAIKLEPGRGELLAAVIAAATIQAMVQVLTLARVELHNRDCEKRGPCRYPPEEGANGARTQ